MIKTNAALAACVEECDGESTWASANDDAPAVSLASVLEAVEEEAAKYRRRTDNTAIMYAYARRSFCRFALAHGICSVGQITVEVLCAYVDEMQAAGRAAETIKIWASYIRRLVLDAAAFGRATSIDGRLMRWQPRSDDSTRKPHVRQALNPEEVQAVLAAAEQRGLRTLALVHLALCGLRTAEVAGVRVCDVDVEGARVRITGKGRAGEEWVTVPVDTITTIRAYLGNLDRPPAGEDSLWGARTAGWVQAQLRALLNAAGITREGVCPHSFRHTAATYLLAHGVPLAHVSQYLRHAEPKTTMRYAHDLGAASTAAALTPLVTGALTATAQAVHQ